MLSNLSVLGAVPRYDPFVLLLRLIVVRFNMVSYRVCGPQFLMEGLEFDSQSFLLCDK